MAKRTSAYRRSMAVAVAAGEHNRPKSPLQGLADYLRETFYERLELQVDISIPEQGKSAEAEREDWRKLAEILASRLIHPDDFLVAQFPDLGEGSRPWMPRTPRQLMSRHCMERYQKYAEAPERLKDLEIRIGGDMRRARVDIRSCQSNGKVSMAAACIEVLDDEVTYCLTPLVRYCLARAFAEEFPDQRKHFDRIAARWERTAVVEYITHRRLVDQTLLARFLPKDFLESAAEFYKDIYFGPSNPHN